MSFRVIIELPAAQDINSAYNWITERNPDAAVSWFIGMEAAIKTLANFPQRCPLAEESRAFDREIRQLVVGRRIGAYRVLFTVEADAVHILHVRHGRRKRLRPE